MVCEQGALPLKKAKVKVGCCGFAAAQKKYAQLFPVIEVQQTFYQPPALTTLQRWRQVFPPEFEFTLKAWQLITHEAHSKTYHRLKLKLSEEERQQSGFFKDSPIVRQAWETTYACATALHSRLVLFQCPASFKPTPINLERMRTFFGSIKRGGLQLVWEPRGDWPDQLVTELCQELDLIHGVDPFVRPSLTPRLSYYRLHGGKDYRHKFEEAELAALIKQLPPEGESYVLFNNINMLEDAQKFQSLLANQPGYNPYSL